MREIFAADHIADPGRVFYTLRQADVGRQFIHTEISGIYLASVIGKVQQNDVGKRLYRVPADDGTSWIWQCENNEQRDARLAKAGG